MKTPRLLLTACCLALLLDPAPAPAFCGFYVAKADTKLFNKASKVVLVRDGDRTVLTMANDYQGEPKDFAVVIPVPTFIQKDQIHVTEMKIVDHLDAYSAPRLVEYFDEDPCRPIPMPRMMMSAAPAAAKGMADRAQSLGVKIEATYTVGEYDIMILSSEQSGGLITFLKEEGYKLPDGADEVVGSYLKQNMRFFVAKVNMEEKAKLGTTYLRPLQVAYESPKFMLPIRLGTVNADGPQELFIFVLAKDGRVETTNYRTVKLPSDVEVPVYIKNEFGPFYRALFDTAVKKEDMRAVFLEYAWDMGWCDPCAADPLTNDELRELGVFWLEGDQKPRSPWGGGGQPVYVTRLHVRYDREHFPDDLVFQQTSDRQNFQGRYILRHPWKGAAECEAGRKYFEALPAKLDQQAQNCARLTGWDIAEIRRKMGVDSFVPPASSSGSNWWNKIWK
jgi:hypothetical protein